MRKELEIIQIIEKYLNNELSTEDKAAFEEKLNNNPDLKLEVDKQRLIQEGVTNVALKGKIQKAWKSYRLGKFGTMGSIATLVIIAATAATLWFANQTPEQYAENIKYTLNESGEEVWADADELVPAQFFTVNADEDNVLQTEGGLVVAIPKGSLLQNGKPVTGNIEIEIKEALTPEDIVLSGLSTKSGDQLLETGGMFYFNARKDGENLDIDKENGIIVDVPTDDYKAGMELYDGVRKEDGSIDWQSPKPIETFLTTVDIATLDFYPPKYENTLVKLGEGDNVKAWKDSLYYSFAGEINDCYLDDYNICWKTSVINYGELLILQLEADIPPNWHMYSENNNSEGPLPMFISFEENDILRYNEWKWNNAISIYDPTWEMDISSFKDKAIIQQGIALSTQENHKVVKVNVNYMLCNNGTCYPPVNIELEFDLSNITESELWRYQFADSLSRERNNLQINPAKIKTIWDKKFNNTLLATKEFEERLSYVFQTCDDDILDLYVNNLDKRMSTIDSMVVEKLCGGNQPMKTSNQYSIQSLLIQQAAQQAYDSLSRVESDAAKAMEGLDLCSIFQNFALQNKGRVKDGDKAAQLLSDYYAKQSKANAQALAKTQKEYWMKYEKLSQDLSQMTSEQQQKEIERLTNNFKEECELNLEDACRQLGIKKKMNWNTKTSNNYTAPITSTGWKNIDRAVVKSVINRETLNYTENGKTAIIKYEACEVEVTNAKDFERVMVYLMPRELNSFMRMPESNKGFKENLNELIQYQMVAIGMNDNEIYYAKQDEALPQKYSLTLEKTTKKELRKLMRKGNVKSVRNDVLDDVKFQLNSMRMKKEKTVFEDMARFRNEIQQVIFPCAIYPMLFESAVEAE